MDERIGLKTYLSELKWFGKLGLPLAVNYFLNALHTNIALAYAGRLTTEELSAWGLALAFYSVTVIAFFFALGYAFCGRFGRAFGAHDLELLRDELHRSIIFCAIVFLGSTVPLTLLNEYILHWVSPDDKVTILTGQYLLILLPSGLFRAVTQVLYKWCEAQSVALPPLIMNFLIAVLIGGLCPLCVWPLGLGGYGIAVAISIASLLMPVLLVVLMLPYRKLRMTRFWRPRLSCLERAPLAQVMRLTLSSILTSLLTFFAATSGNFLAGRLGKTDLAVQSIIRNCASLFQCVSLGLCMHMLFLEILCFLPI